MLCSICAITKVDFWERICSLCESRSLTSVLAEFETHRDQARKTNQKDDNLIVCDIVFLIRNWPPTSVLENLDTTPRHAHYVQDHIFRELYVIAVKLHTIGGNDLRHKIMKQVFIKGNDIEKRSIQIPLKDALKAIKSSFADSFVDSFADCSHASLKFTKGNEHQHNNNIIRLHNEIVTHLPLCVALLISAYTPICNCKCQILDLAGHVTTVGCDKIACNKHLSCTCCQLVCNSTNKCHRKCCLLCSSACHFCERRLCEKSCVCRCIVNCDKTFCNQCGVRCAGCEENLVCQSCAKTSVCTKCSNVFCDSCIRNCSTCNSQVCCTLCGSSCSLCGACCYLCTHAACAECDNVLCSKHTISCADCGRSVCNTPLSEQNVIRACGVTASCSNCVTSVYCKTCVRSHACSCLNIVFCNECDQFGEWCASCGIIVCSKCTGKCDTCKGIICPKCEQKRCEQCARREKCRKRKFA
jgi:hypothetical protein